MGLVMRVVNRFAIGLGVHTVRIIAECIDELGEVECHGVVFFAETIVQPRLATLHDISSFVITRLASLVNIAKLTWRD